MVEVRWTHAAVEDGEAIAARLLSASREACRDGVRAIVRMVETVGGSPADGAPCGGRVPDAVRWREEGGCRVVYRFRSDVVKILGVSRAPADGPRRADRTATARAPSAC